MKKLGRWGYVGLTAAALAVAALFGIWLHSRPSWGQPTESAAAMAAALLTAITAVAAASSAANSAKAAEMARRSLAMHSPPMVNMGFEAIEGQTPTVALTCSGARPRSILVAWTPEGGSLHERRFSSSASPLVVPLDDAIKTLLPPGGANTTPWLLFDQFEVQMTDDQGFHWTSQDQRVHNQMASGDTRRGFELHNQEITAFFELT